MVSLCLKSLTKKDLEKIEVYIEKSHLDNSVYSIRKFSKFYNLIIHYNGLDSAFFYDSIFEILSNYIINNYEEKILVRQLKHDFFYFSKEEHDEILTKLKNTLNNNFLSEKEYHLMQDITSYIQSNRSFIIDGFINFRLSKYSSFLNNCLENSVHEFIIHKEYLEYIDLLKDYIHEKTPQTELIHLIYSDTEKSIVDDNHKLITTTSKKKYLSDISFSENDFLLNSLLSLSPQKIIIHSDGNQDFFLQFLNSIFEDRCEFCSDCTFCLKKSELQIP